MGGIRFDQLDPETQRRILQELREQVEGAPPAEPVPEEPGTAREEEPAPGEPGRGAAGPVSPPQRGMSPFTILIMIGVLIFGVYYACFGQTRDLNDYIHASGGDSVAATAADTVPPELAVSSPQGGIRVEARAPDVWFAGRTEPGAVVMLELEGATRELSVDQQGNFGEYINLLEVLEGALRAKAGSLGLAAVPGNTGQHTVRVTAMDAANNETAKEVGFYFDDPADAVPDDYYRVFPAYYDNTLGDLKRRLDYLMRFVDAPGKYKYDVLDCSESAAMMENFLQNSGFDAWIAVGPTPWVGGKGTHAWVIVKARDGTVAVEPTMWLGSPWRFGWLIDFGKKVGWLMGFQPGVTTDPMYFKYNRLYDNVYEAVRAYGSEQEWDWWNELRRRGAMTCIPSVDGQG